MKFERDNVYIVKASNDKWYIVRQIGMKSWVATEFANLEVGWDDTTYRDNGVGLWVRLAPREFRKITNRLSSNPRLRKLMFDVLKYGTFKDLKDK